MTHTTSALKRPGDICLLPGQCRGVAAEMPIAGNFGILWGIQIKLLNDSRRAGVRVRLEHALNVKGWHVEDIYIDISSGDTIEKRPEFMRMLSDVKNGKITLVITKSVSRFGRNTEEVLISFRAIKEAGAEIYFDEQGLTSRDPNCELYLV